MMAPKIENGDLVIENNDFILIDGDEELAQSIKTVLLTQKEEFFLNPEHGLFRENILGKEANQTAATDDIIEAISQEERIESTEEINFTDDRNLRIRDISLTLQKVDGETLTIEEVELDAG